MKFLTIISLLLHLAFENATAQIGNNKSFISKGIEEFKKQKISDIPNYELALKLLEGEVKLYPKNAELRYFLGNTIDKINLIDGKTLINVREILTKQASAEIENCIKISPKYSGEIIALDPYSKLTSIWGTLGLKYLYEGKTELARTAFYEGKKRGGFIKPFLEYYKQLLNSCDSNSILIVGGDIEFYSILYLQLILNYRTDIKIVDNDLLNTNWYYQYLVKREMLDFSLTEETINSIDLLNVWEPQEIIIETNNSNGNINFVLKPSYLNKYLLRSDILLVDIIRKNINQRKIYFDRNQEESFFVSLTEYLLAEGLVYSLRTTKFDFTIDKVEISKNFQNYNCNQFGDKELRNSQDAQLLINNFQDAFCATILNLIRQNSIEQANSLFKLLEFRFPKSKYPMNGIEDKYQKIKSELK